MTKLTRLPTPTYKIRLKAHLASYKSEHFPTIPDGTWTNGSSLPYLLPPASRHLNLLPTYRDEISKFLRERPEIRLHRFFHHLNSSQAMCLNLLWPALHSARGGEALRQVLGLKGAIDIGTSGFEIIPDPDEGTSFDCVVQSDAGESVFMELKLSEESFGTALNDLRHLAKLERVYVPRLEGRIPSGWFEQPCEFFSRYQMLRNLSHARTEGDSVVFLLPKENDRLVRDVLQFLEAVSHIATPPVRLIFLEDFVTQLRWQLDTDELQDHYREFARKYII